MTTEQQLLHLEAELSGENWVMTIDSKAAYRGGVKPARTYPKERYAMLKDTTVVPFRQMTQLTIP